MEMFWLKRLKSREGSTEWALSYGDMMSLLLAVFVMIAAMSELKSGTRFLRVADGVRSALGFGRASELDRPAPLAGSRRLTLVERLEHAGVVSRQTTAVRDEAGDTLAPMDVRSEPGRIRLRIPGDAVFEPASLVMKPEARRLVARLSEFLAGQACIEVCGYADAGAAEQQTTLRDGWDLAYGRARMMAGLLAEGGVGRERIALVVPALSPEREAAGAVADTRGMPAGGSAIEIIVHAGAPAEHDR